MPYLYLATLGQRPQAITVAFDVLKERYGYARIGILHTDPLHSGIVTALSDLKNELAHAYPHLPVDLYEIIDLHGQSLLDIEDDASAEAYFYGVLKVLLSYKQHGWNIHVMVAGGRKAMSVYSVYAASLLLDEHDSVWTILTPPDIMSSGVYHVQPSERERIKVMSLPFLPSRFAPTTLETLTHQDIIDYLQRRLSRKELLLSRLTPAQQRVATALALHDDYSDEQLAKALVLSIKTIQRHLQDIYGEIRASFDFSDKIRDMRLALIKVMKGWE